MMHWECEMDEIKGCERQGCMANSGVTRHRVGQRYDADQLFVFRTKINIFQILRLYKYVIIYLVIYVIENKWTDPPSVTLRMSKSTEWTWKPERQIARRIFFLKFGSGHFVH